MRFYTTANGQIVHEGMGAFGVSFPSATTVPGPKPTPTVPLPGGPSALVDPSKFQATMVVSGCRVPVSIDRSVMDYVAAKYIPTLDEVKANKGRGGANLVNAMRSDPNLTAAMRAISAAASKCNLRGRTPGVMRMECCPKSQPYSNPPFGCCIHAASTYAAHRDWVLNCVPPSAAYCDSGGGGGGSKRGWAIAALIGLAALAATILSDGAAAPLLLAL